MSRTLQSARTFTTGSASSTAGGTPVASRVPPPSPAGRSPMAARGTSIGPADGPAMRRLASDPTAPMPGTLEGFDASATDREVGSLRILACSWNVGEAPPPRDLHPWIPAAGAEFDVIAVAIQESVYSAKKKKKKDKDATASPSPKLKAASAPAAAAGGGAGGLELEGVELVEDEGDEEEDSDDEPVEGEAAELEEEPETPRVAAASAAAVAALEASPEADPHSDDPRHRAAELRRKARFTSPQVELAHAEGGGMGARLKRASVIGSGATGAVGAGVGGAGAGAVGGASTATAMAEVGVGVAGSAAAGGSTGLARLDPGVAQEMVMKRSPFYGLVLQHVGPLWRVVECVMLGQIGLMVLVRDRLREQVADVEWDTEATGGPTRSFPNKGGCVLSFSIFDTSLCFVGSHLAAHQEFAKTRDMDVAEIVDQVRMGQELVDFDAQYNHVFWLGDLNYRVDLSLTDRESKSSAERTEEVIRMVADKRYTALMDADQLRHRQREGLVFCQFDEPPYPFPPTFKVERKDGYSYQKKRIPSYCDRVLYRSMPRLKNFLRCQGIQGFGELATSDHKPVAAAFQLSCRAAPALKEDKDSGPVATLRFTRLQGERLMVSDVSGLSDPYIMFLADPSALIMPQPLDGKCCGKGPAAEPRTRVIEQTLNPIWNPATDIPELRVRVSNPAQLMRCHLFLVVMDWDRLNRDDRMGQAVLSLAPLGSANKFEFNIPVTMDTTRQGTLRGEVEVVWPSSARRASVAASAAGGGGGAGGARGGGAGGGGGTAAGEGGSSCVIA